MVAFMFRAGGPISGFKACGVCLRRKKACKWSPGLQKCERCVSLGTACSGIPGSRARQCPSDTPPTLVDLVPSTAAENNLGTVTLSVALRYHLIESCLNNHKYKTAISIDLVHLFKIYRATRAKAAQYTGVEELMTTACMYSGALLTSHSGVVGPDLARSAPAVNKLANGMEVSGRYRYGFARRGTLQSLADKMVEQLGNLPPLVGESSVAAKKFCIAVASVKCTNFVSVVDPPIGLRIIKSLMSVGKGLQERDDFSNSETQDLNACLDFLSEALTRCSFENNSFVERRIHQNILSSNPFQVFPAEQYSAEDMDFVLGITSLLPTERREQAKRLSIKYIEPVDAWEHQMKRALVTVRETAGLERTAFFMWVAMDSFWKFIDDNLNSMFEHPLYASSSRENTAPLTVLGSLRQGEMTLDLLLVFLHNFLPSQGSLQTQSVTRVMSVLSRMAAYCQQIDYLRHLFDRILRFEVESQIVDIVGRVRSDVLERWVSNSREEGRQLLSGLREISFSSPVAARLVCDLDSYLGQ